MRAVRACGLFLGVSLLVALTPLTASAQSPGLKGTIQGTLTKGSTITIRMTAAQQGGFQHIDQMRVVLVLHGVLLDDIVYDQSAATVTVGPSLPVPIGSQGVGQGSFFHVSGRDVALASSGNALSVRIDATLLQDIPPGAAFSLGAGNDEHYPVTWISVVAHLPPPPPRGVPWGAVIAAVLIALLIGGTVGSLSASRRRPPQRVHVYSSIQRKLAEERGNR